MGILLIIFLVYPLWGAPALIAFNFFLTKNLGANHGLPFTGLVSILTTCALFMPLVSESGTFFSETYFPWYISFAFTPPSPSFSLMGFLATVGLSIVTTTVTALFYLQNKKDVIANVFSKFDQ